MYLRFDLGRRFRNRRLTTRDGVMLFDFRPNGSAAVKLQMLDLHQGNFTNPVGNLLKQESAMRLDRVGARACSDRSKAVKDRWNAFRKQAKALSSWARLPSEETEAIARDLRLSIDDLHTIVSAGDRVSPLIESRLATSRLSRDVLQQQHPAVLRDIVKVCAGCDSKSFCEHAGKEEGDLRSAVERCPNTPTIDALVKDAEAQQAVRDARVWPMCC